ncbi:hypothetical protein [Salinirarus marinus]
MDQQFKQSYRMHRVLSNLNRLDVDRLDDADRERVGDRQELLIPNPDHNPVRPD